MTTPTVATIEQLRAGLAELQMTAPQTLAEHLVEFGELLLEKNKQTNLVGARTLDGLIVAHFLDSLAPVAGVTLDPPIIDVGSGGGLPGIPIALAHPSTQIVLLEPRAKRVAFLSEVIQRLGLNNVEVEKVTAETAGRSSWRGHASTVLIRAVAQPLEALEMGLPLLRIGGVALLYLGRRAVPDSEELEMAHLLGGRLVKATPVSVPYLTGERHAWWFEKVSPTPAGYPRRPARRTE